MDARFSAVELEQHKLNLETGKIPWTQLQRHFASGRLIAVVPELDLLEVAAQFSLDDKAKVQRWLDSGQVHPVSDDEARAWHDCDAVLWAVVVKPWVVVQARPDDGS